MLRLHLTALRVSALTTLLLLGGYAMLGQTPVLRNLETKLLDLRLHLGGAQRPEAPIALVLIDDKSIAELGRWPWSRRLLARAVSQMHRAGARVIAFDLLFSEAEKDPTRDVLHNLRTTFDALDLPQDHDALHTFRQTLVHLDESATPDAALAAALRDVPNTLLAFSFEPGDAATTAPDPPPAVSAAAYRAVQHLGLTPPTLPLRAAQLLLPLAPLAQAAQSLGHVKIVFDTDGSPRYDYPVVPYQDAYYPSFAMQTLRLYLGLTLEEVHVRFGEGIQLGPQFIPLDESNRLLTRYYGPAGTFPTYAFVDVLHNRLPATALQDRIVLVGANASGLGDTFITPFSLVLPGVERHATVMANILRGEWLQRRDTMALFDLGTMLVLGLTLGWLGSTLPWSWGMLVTLLLGLGYVYVNTLACLRWNLWLNLLFPCFTILGNYGAITSYQFLTEARQRRMLRKAFQYYLHPAVVEQISQHPERLALGGEKRELTVLFSDIRGFSTFAETLTPERLVQLLNEYFTAMTQAVFAEDGLLDKYIGDAIMAVYGAPLAMPEHAYRACQTALRMLEALATLQPRWQARGLPVIHIGIGINSGPMVVGNMGSDVHFAYTAMGDEVNLGSRLEGVTKEYGASIIISETTWQYVNDRLATRELDIIRVKGKEHPTRIFELLGPLPLSPAHVQLVQHFTAGLQAYRAQHWDVAMHCFQEALCVVPDDPPSQLYLRRCREFRYLPPPAPWDGVYSMLTK
jgi:adenylate cyclase